MKLSDPTHGLFVFQALVQTGSVTRAAAQLGVTKAAVSLALRRLEAEMDVRLFHRSTRGIHLTEEGQRYFDSVQLPWRALLQAREEIGSGAAIPRGHLRITAPFVCHEWVMLPALQRLRESAPQVTVEVDLNDAFVDIVRGGFDAGLRLSTAVSSDMIGRQVEPSQPCAVIAAPVYLEALGALPKKPVDLLNLDCIGYSIKGQIIPWEFGHGERSQLLHPQPRCIFNSLAACVSAARCGLGVAYAIPRALVAEDLARGNLVELLPGEATPLPPLMIYFSGRRHLPPKLRALIEALAH